jgi:hypothetical protein
VPFKFLDDWKKAQDKQFVNGKALCQEALFEAYLKETLYPNLFQASQKKRMEEAEASMSCHFELGKGLHTAQTTNSWKIILTSD